MQNLQNLSSFKIIKRILKDYVSRYKGRMALAVFFMIIVASCTAAIVKLVEPAINEVFLSRNEKMLVIFPFLMFLVYFIKGIAEYFQIYIIQYVGQRILTNIQIAMYEHLLLSDIAFIHQQSSGRLISRFTNDIVLMRGVVSHMVVGFAKYLLSVILLIGVMFNLDPFLSIFVFLAFPLAIYPIQKIGRRMRQTTNLAQEELSNYTAKLDETFHSIKVIKSFSGELVEAERARNITDKILNFYKRAAKFNAFTSPIMEILSGVAISGILWYGGLMVVEGNTTPGALLSFITAFVASYRPFKSLVSLNVNLQEGLSAANRIFNILDTKPQIHDINNAIQPDITNSAITIQNVALHFGKKIALNEVSLTIEPKKTYAFVGKSGSGKTSVANLLVRFYDPTSGVIQIGDNDIKNISLKHLRSQISLVTQDTILFDGSIFENIIYGRLNASKDEVIKAAKAADAHEFIVMLPEGYDTQIGFGGITLSGGQKQRISIARAFVKNAPILLLDEATSSLDIASESKIVQAIKQLSANRTTVIITHRLNSIVDADQIIVMNHGKVAEQGTHEELLNNQKEYYKLYNKQLKETDLNV